MGRIPLRISRSDKTCRSRGGQEARVDVDPLAKYSEQRMPAGLMASGLPYCSPGEDVVSEFLGLGSAPGS